MPKDKGLRPGYVNVFYRDLIPLDIGINSAFDLQAIANEANELVLSYKATRKTRIGHNGFQPGDTIQFILATPASVRAAVESAQRIGGYCAGVVFFRWPGPDEGLVMQPSEVLIAAGVIAEEQRKPAAIYLVDGGCAALHCMDVYLMNGNPAAQDSVRYRIRSSTELEYFLPEERVPVRMSGLDALELSLPPYCGRSRLYLGRAVSGTAAEFSIEEER